MSFTNAATSKQLWKINNLAYTRAVLVNTIRQMGGDVDVTPEIRIPMPMFKDSAHELIKLELEKIQLLEDMKKLLLEEVQ